MPDDHKGKVERLNPETFEALRYQQILLEMEYLESRYSTLELSKKHLAEHVEAYAKLLEARSKYEKGFFFRIGMCFGNFVSIISEVINVTVKTVVIRSMSIQDMLENGFPKLTMLLAYFLPKKVRRDCFEPTREEILEDYYHTRNDPQYAGKLIRIWLLFCFLFRTGVLWLVCLMLWLGDSVLQRVLRVMPASFQSWWNGRPNSSA